MTMHAWVSYLLVMLGIAGSAAVWMAVDNAGVEQMLATRRCEFELERSKILWATERTQLADELRSMNSQLVALKFKEAHDEQRLLLGRPEARLAGPKL
jgi:hypothetical protein